MSAYKRAGVRVSTLARLCDRRTGATLPFECSSIAVSARPIVRFSAGSGFYFRDNGHFMREHP